LSGCILFEQNAKLLQGEEEAKVVVVVAEQLRLAENVKPNQHTPEVRQTRLMFLIGLN